VLSLDDLIAMDARELDAAMREGHPIEEGALEDREYEGVSLNLPRWLIALTWTKFKKTFHRDPRDGALRGWNCRAIQSPLDQPWEIRMRGGKPVTFGHYRVVSNRGYALPRAYGAGWMLDYGLGKNGLLDPSARVRDPIVAVNAGRAELLLGWTYVDLGIFRVPTPSFFALRRGCALSHVAYAPRDRRPLSDPS
jgi:hypothetical protein